MLSSVSHQTFGSDSPNTMSFLPATSSIARKNKRRSFTRWLRPYHKATTGGESAMLRYLDDPDVPCYATGWLKADKNRFHQERAPGASKKYVFNPSSWVYAFRDSLTAVSVANEWPYPGNSVPNQGWGSKRGVTLVTPRHVICSHGGLQTGTVNYPTKFRFVGTDGETYDRTVIGFKYCGGPSTVNIGGVAYSGDVNILTLNADLPAAVIPIRCIPDDRRFHISNQSYGTWDALFVSQSIELDSPTPNEFGEQARYYPEGYYPPSNYPRRHRSMCCFPWSSDPKVGYYCWGGDSGMPKFYGYQNELLFAGFVGGGGVGADFYPVVHDGVTITWETLINTMISLSDANAGISQTGYTITLANEFSNRLPY